MGRRGILHGGRVRALAAVAALVACILAWPADGQVVCTGGGCGGGGAVTSPVTTDPVSATGVWTFDNAANTPVTLSDGAAGGTLCSVGVADTANSVCLGSSTITGEGSSADGFETLLAFGNATADGTLTATGTATGVNLQVTTPANTELRLTQTLPASPSAQANGLNIQVTSAGSAAQVQAAFQSSLLAGYTGASGTYGGLFTNVSVGSGGNTGVFGSATGTTGTIQVRGVYGQGGGGGVNVTGVGLLGLGNGGLSAIGADLLANTATNQIGLRATLGLTPSTATSAVILADNASVAAPIAIFRDNGTAVFTLGDGGTTSLIAGTGTGRVSLGGVICKGAPAQATTGTSEEILATCTIPASTLSANGSMLRVSVFGITANNGNNKTLKVRVGGIGGTVVYSSSAVGAVNQDFWMLEPVHIQRTGATTAATWGYGAYLGDVTVTAGVTSFGTYAARAAAITWANANDLVITGTTPTSAGDMTLTAYMVEVVQ